MLQPTDKISEVLAKFPPLAEMPKTKKELGVFLGNLNALRQDLLREDLSPEDIQLIEHFARKKVYARSKEMSTMSVYRIIESLKEFAPDLCLDRMELDSGWWEEKGRKRAILELVVDLEHLLTEQGSNPLIIDLFKQTKGLKTFLQRLTYAYTNDAALRSWVGQIKQPITAREVIYDLRTILARMEWWEETIRKKVDIVGESNAHLADLKTHPVPERFYAKVLELNPLRLERRHPYNDRQLAHVAKYSTQDLLRPDEKDMIKGARIFGKKDTTSRPGSIIKVTDGHHRLFEIYRRYLRGEIDGEALVEFANEG